MKNKIKYFKKLKSHPGYSLAAVLEVVSVSADNASHAILVEEEAEADLVTLTAPLAPLLLFSTITIPLI